MLKPITKYHYVYIITHKITGMSYIGKRSCNVEPTLDLCVKYFTSSSVKEFKMDLKENTINYTYIVYDIFNSANEALETERSLHHYFDVDNNKYFYNKVKQSVNGFSWSGKKHSEETKNKIREANINKKVSEETKKKISEKRKGIKHSDNTKNNMSENRKGYLNNMYGKNHSEETKKKISKSNYGRKMSDEFKQNLSDRLKDNHPMSGKTHSDEAKRKISDKNKGKLLGKSKSEETKKKMAEYAKTMVSLQDKYGNFLRVPKDDIRYLNKELFGVSAKTFKHIDIHGNIYFVPRHHPEVLSGELIEVL